MWYELKMYAQNSTICAIVKNPTFEYGVVKAKKVGEIGSSITGGIKYTKCDEKDVIFSPPYTLEEFKGTLDKK